MRARDFSHFLPLFPTLQHQSPTYTPILPPKMLILSHLTPKTTPIFNTFLPPSPCASTTTLPPSISPVYSSCPLSTHYSLPAVHYPPLIHPTPYFPSKSHSEQRFPLSAGITLPIRKSLSETLLEAFPCKLSILHASSNASNVLFSVLESRRATFREIRVVGTD